LDPNPDRTLNEIFLSNSDARSNCFLDDLSRTFRIISKSIGCDWNRLYWQLPFYPTRGHEKLSNDIKHINKKYQRGDIFQVNINLHSFII
jgi:hypothetical protein